MHSIEIKAEASDLLVNSATYTSKQETVVELPTALAQNRITLFKNYSFSLSYHIVRYIFSIIKEENGFHVFKNWHDDNKICSDKILKFYCSVT